MRSWRENPGGHTCVFSKNIHKAIPKTFLNRKFIETILFNTFTRSDIIKLLTDTSKSSDVEGGCISYSNMG